MINIGNEVKVAADIFWGGSCVLDSECFYFTMFGTVFQVSSCDTRSVAILGNKIGKLDIFKVIKSVPLTLLVR